MKRTLRLYQRGYEENSLLSNIIYLILYAILIPETEHIQAHYMFSPLVYIPFIAVIVFRVLLVLFAPDEKQYHKVAGISIVVSGIFWPLFFFLESMQAETGSKLLMFLPIWVVGISSAAAMALYKRYSVMISFESVMLLTPIVYLQFLRRPHYITYTVAFAFMFIYMAYYGWKNYKIFKELEKETLENELKSRELAVSKSSLEIANRELKTALAKANEAARSKSEFLANMSHEIRTPMNGIIGVTELLTDRLKDEEDLSLLKIIDDSAQSLLTLINDILDFSKIEAGKLEILPEPFNLQELTESIIDRFALKAFSKNVELLYMIERDVPLQLKGDKERISQVITNLLGNAIKFTEKGQVFLHIHLIEQTHGKANIRFTIEDTGIGISKDKIDKIFESFTQEDGSTSRKYGGTGLGTTISKMLVELMGGKIWATSPNPNNRINDEPGSIFTFNLPLAVYVEKASKKEVKHQEIPDLSQYNILAVDDNPTNLRIISMILSKWKIKHRLSSSPKEAMDMLREQHFDLLISDYSMPETNGFELIEQIKAKGHKTLKTIVLSSDSVNTNRQRAKERGIDFLIYKPLKQSSLYNALLQTLEIENTDTKPKSRHLINQIPHADQYKILLAEDNTINQKVAYRIFSSLGFTIDIAENGKIALEMALNKKYDLIFMDYQMPEMNGIETTQALRKWKITTPIVALTANAMKGDREQFLDAGMDDYISKPFKVAELLEVLNKYLIKDEA